MKAIYLCGLLALLVVCVCASQRSAGAQSSATVLDKSYKAQTEDYSHCLIGTEIRGDKDNSISCICRLAIVDARYVQHTYVDSGKDPNLTDTVALLVSYISEVCGDNSQSYDGGKQVFAESWKWDGPEVERTYPSDSEIERITPDSHGLRRVRYKVRLIFRDQQGQVRGVEDFTAVDLAPSHWKRDGERTPHGAVGVP